MSGMDLSELQRLRDGTSIFARPPRFDRPTHVSDSLEEEERYRPISWRMLRRIGLLLWPQRRVYVVCMLLVVFGSAIEQLDKAFIGQIVDEMVLASGSLSEGASRGWMAGWLDVFLPAGSFGRVLFWCGAWFGVFAVGILIHRYVIIAQARAGEQIIARFRERVFAHLQSLSMNYYDRTKLGQVITRGSSDVDMLRDIVLNGLMFIAVNGTMMVVSAVMILLTDWRLFLALAWLAPVQAVLNAVYRRRVGRAHQLTRMTFSRLTANLAENITGMRVVTAFDRNETNLHRFNDLQDENSSNNYRGARINGVYQPLLAMIQFVGQVCILVYGGYQVSQGEMMVGAVVAVFLYWRAYMQPAINFGNFYNQLMMAMASAERVFYLLDVRPQVTDRPDAVALPRLRGEVRFEDVTFGYDPARPVLHGVSFTAAPGTQVALVGHTGSGKTSIVSLLSRFYQPQSGRILLDGHDIAGVTAESLYGQVGLVLQHQFLFSGTVLDNIRYARPSATKEQVRQVAADLGLLELLEDLDHGLDTDVGERGSGLSVGQRQVVCICRAMLADPRLLMLDEATSAMDAATEQRLQLAMERVCEGRTTIIIAHRLSTIMRADQILLLENGRIIERGTNAELLSAGGKYAELHSHFALGYQAE